jgi:hypothetical protein
MEDSEFWKRHYKDKWKEGNQRSKKIIDLINSWGFRSEEFGFLATSEEYVKESPDEKGKPDWKIIVNQEKNIFLETTGTIKSRGKDDVWIRNDKFEFAENHPELECWAGHIIEDKGLIRFLKLEKKERFPLEERIIRDTTERFRIIPDGNHSLLSIDDFKTYLESLR